MTWCADEFVVVSRGTQLAMVRPHRLDGVRARLQARSLDRRLAAGETAESDRLLAVRTRQLVRRVPGRLATRWQAVATAVPECAEVWQVADLLGSGRAPAHAIAAAATMLPVARSGLAQRGRHGLDLSAAAARSVLGSRG